MYNTVTQQYYIGGRERERDGSLSSLSLPPAGPVPPPHLTYKCTRELTQVNNYPEWLGSMLPLPSLRPARPFGRIRLSQAGRGCARMHGSRVAVPSPYFPSISSGLEVLKPICRQAALGGRTGAVEHRSVGLDGLDPLGMIRCLLQMRLCRLAAMSSK